MEYASAVWYPILRRDANLLEQTQRRATRLGYGIRRPSYAERLTIMNLEPISTRLRKVDLITTYKILRSKFNVDLSYIYRLQSDSRLRGHPWGLNHQTYASKCRQFFLSNRIFSEWNSLDPTTVAAPTVNIFKKEINSVTFI